MKVVADDNRGSIRTKSVDFQRKAAIWSRSLVSRSDNNKSSAHPTAAPSGRADEVMTNFLSPKNEDFPYDLVYTPLTCAPNDGIESDFRVVRILPGSENDPVQCELLPSKLGSATPYEALSYCAGDANDCRSIFLNNFPFNTFRSTYEALVHFRDRQETVVLWVDQVCINQADRQERDSQVLLMKSIYMKAERTQIWLGEAGLDPPSSLAFDLLHDFLRDNREKLRKHIMNLGTVQPSYKHTGNPLRDYLHAENEWHRYYNSSRSRHKAQRRKEARQDPILTSVSSWLQAATNEPSRVKSWLALVNLFERGWWTRCWVVQEAVVSDKLQINCGANSIAWEDFCLLFVALYTVDKIQGVHVQIFKALELENSLRLCMYTQNNIHASRCAATDAKLGSYLAVYRNNIASDPRDKIFSMLGLLSDQQYEEYAITPSYASENTVAKVYLIAAKAILRRDHDLTLLENISGREQEAGLPTWVPDWSQAQASGPNAFGARFEAGSRQRKRIRIPVHGRILMVHGYVFTSIEFAGPVDDGGNGLKVLAAWESLFISQMSGEIDTHALDKFYRTLNLDLWIGDLPDPDGDAEEFRSDWRSMLKFRSKTFTTRLMRWRFFVSQSGAPGMVTRNGREGDQIFVPWGSQIPFAIRRTGEQAEHYHLVGPCYLHGMMHGEVFELEKEGKLESKDIYLV